MKSEEQVERDAEVESATTEVMIEQGIALSPDQVNSIDLEAATDHAAELQQWQDRVKHSAAEVQSLQDKYFAAKEAANAAKKRWESAAEALVEFIGFESQPLPLFDRAKQEDAEPVDSDDEWQDHAVDILELSPKLTARLIEAGIGTLGRLAKWTTEGKNLTDISGVGEVAAEKIREASDHFFATRPDRPQEDGRSILSMVQEAVV